LSDNRRQQITDVQSKKRPQSFRKSKALANECDFPNIIEISLPEKGLDIGLSRKIARFHSERNIRPLFGRTRNECDRRYGRWCFSDPLVADEFRKQFGGERVINET
jgi:hypothetical protein